MTMYILALDGHRYFHEGDIAGRQAWGVLRLD